MPFADIIFVSVLDSSICYLSAANLVAVIYFLPLFFSLFPFFPLFLFPLSPPRHTSQKSGEAKDGDGGGEAIESNRFENLIGGKHGKSITNFWIAIVSRRTSNINTFSFRYLYQWGTQRVYEYAPIFPVSVEHYAKGEKFDISYRIRSALPDDFP